MAASSQNVVNTGSWWLVRQFNSRRTKTQVGFEPARKHNRLIIPFYPEDGTLATMATLARLPAGERMSIDATTLHDRTGAKLLRLAGVGGDNVIKLGDKVVMYHRDCVVVGTVTTATGSIIKHDDLRREEPDSVELWLERRSRSRRRWQRGRVSRLRHAQPTCLKRATVGRRRSQWQSVDFRPGSRREGPR